MDGLYDRTAEMRLTYDDHTLTALGECSNNAG